MAGTSNSTYNDPLGACLPNALISAGLATWTLLSPDDQEKLAKLVIGDQGLEISGTVNAENVQGLETWITNNAGNVIGLSPLPFTSSLATSDIVILFEQNRFQ